MTAQKNFRRIPEWVFERLQELTSNDFRVEVVLEVAVTDVIAGAWTSLGLTVEAGELKAPTSILPAVTAGRYSRANREGYEKIRRDLPKGNKTYSWYSPNFGDWTKGSHLVSRTREVYRRDVFPPNNIELRIEVMVQAEVAQVKVSVDRVLDRTIEGFETDLFADLNLLQENAGAVDIYSSDTTRAAYLALTRVDWELLPPGEAAQVIEQTVAGTGVSVQDRQRVQERMDVLRNLEPVEFVMGRSGFSRYFGAKYGPDLVILENLWSGNAIYVMHENWAELSQLSRTGLLSRPWESFERIIHRPGWQHRVHGVVDAYRAGLT